MQLNWNASAKPDHPCPAALNSDTENLLSRLCVQVESFFVGEFSSGIAPGHLAVHQVTVLYVVKGAGWLHWAEGDIPLSAGMIAVIPNHLATILRSEVSREAANNTTTQSGAASHEQPVTEVDDLVVATSIVSASAGHGLGYFQSLEHPLVEDPKDDLLGYIFGGILAEMVTPGIGSKCIVESLMKHVLIILLRRTLLQRKSATPLYLTIANPSLALVINTIQHSHSERLSISGLARLAGMTPLGLTSEFERVFGQGLLEYIQGVRLHQANNLLTQTDLPIKCIAASVGFASRSHFSRAFRKHRGQDPTSFRRSATESVADRGVDQTVLATRSK